MRSALALAQLAVMLAASPAAAAVDFIPACSSSAHVSWRTDDHMQQIDDVVVTVPGCDRGEPVMLQVVTTEGDVPSAPLATAARDGRAVFDVRPFGLGIEPIIGARVTLSGEELEILGQRVGRSGDDRPENGDTDVEGSVLPVSGAQGFKMVAVALALIATGVLALRQRPGRSTPS